MHELGRLHAPDQRDFSFLARDVRRTLDPPSRPYWYWYNRFNLDQTGGTCVANTAVHLLGDSPFPKPLGLAGAGGDNRAKSLTQRVATATGQDYNTLTAYRSPQSGQDGLRGWLYDQAQQRDEWADTPPESGTSWRAMAKVLQDVGVISSYRWITTLQELVKHVVDYGPAAIGATIREGMYVGVPPGGWWRHTGAPVGGHEFVFDGVNVGEEKFRVQTWGVHYWISFTDVEAMLAEAETDVGVVVEA